MTETERPMRERIARVINERANKDYNAYMLDKDASFALADAVLAEIETPTEGMIAAMFVPSLGEEDGDPANIAAYKAAIRAAREGR